MFLGDKIVSTTNDICNLFAMNFKFVYDDDNNKLNNITITLGEVSDCIKKLKNKTSLGCDNLPSFTYFYNWCYCKGFWLDYDQKTNWHLYAICG